ncbi:MAG: hypothetical protein D6710_08535, partial [Nitrospirae bacterium]
IAAPLIMTPHYIASSLDAFPIEFLDFRLIHKTIYGDDLLSDLNIESRHLRLQAEREIKSKLIWLRQGYLSTMGDKRAIIENLSKSISGFMPLFRAIIVLYGEVPPVARIDVVNKLQDITKMETNIYERVLQIRQKKLKPDSPETDGIFKEFYHATERLGRLIDEIQI